MKVYSVLLNSYDYYRFTDYLGTYGSLQEAKQICGSGIPVGVVDFPCDTLDFYENTGSPHQVIVVQDLTIDTQ